MCCPDTCSRSSSRSSTRSSPNTSTRSSPNASARSFIQDPDAMAASAAAAVEAGFDWATINITAIFQSGARSSEQMAEVLEAIHERLRREVGFE